MQSGAKLAERIVQLLHLLVGFNGLLRREAGAVEHLALEQGRSLPSAGPMALACAGDSLLQPVRY